MQECALKIVTFLTILRKGSGGNVIKPMVINFVMLMNVINTL